MTSNFYWLSTTTETLDWKNSKWPATPTASYADYTALGGLPMVTLKVDSRTEQQGKDRVTHVTVENPSQSLAFFIRLKVNNRENGEEILPVVWQDNYFSLMPGEKREVTASYRSRDMGASSPVISVEGWNVAN